MNRFYQFNPYSTLIYFVSITAATMFCFNPIILIESLIGIVLFTIYLKSKKEVISDIGFFIPLFILISITNPLFSHRGVTPLFFMNGNPVTLEAIFYGIAIGFMIVAVVLWFSGFTKIMTSDKFIYIFGRVIPKIALVITMSMRFIPRFKKQMKQVEMSQKTLGLFSSSSYFDRIRSKLKVFMSVLGWSIENSIETADSMRARGYGLRNRTSFSTFRISSGDTLFLSLTLILTFVVIVAGIFGKLTFQFYPQITGIQQSMLSKLAYAAYGLLAILPFIIETMENIKWKYLISKI